MGMEYYEAEFKWVLYIIKGKNGSVTKVRNL